MAKSFKKLVEQMAPERRAKINQMTQELLATIPLQELQRARELTQQQMASTLHVDQNEVAKIEAEADLYVGTLKRFIAALGGELEVIARFPQGNITIDEFRQLEIHAEKV